MSHSNITLLSLHPRVSSGIEQSYAMRSLWPTADQRMEIDQMVSVIPPRPFPTYDHLSYGDFLVRRLLVHFSYAYGGAG